MIIAQNINKLFDTTVALNNISFNIEDNSTIGFLGPNGAGKTTLMNILAGITSASSGNIQINKQPISCNDEHVKKSIGYLAETNPLFETLTVTEYLTFICNLRKLRTIQQTISLTLEQCQLTKVRHKLIGNLSKGFKQRVGLAQAIIHKPRLLILDEPTNGLDPNQIIEFRNLIRSLSDTTVIFCSHILSEVTELCEYIFILDSGEIISHGTKTELQDKHMHQKVIYLEAVAEFKIIQSLLLQSKLPINKINNQSTNSNSCTVEIHTTIDLREDLFELFSKNSLKIRELRLAESSLENIFVKLTDSKKQ